MSSQSIAQSFPVQIAIPNLAQSILTRAASISRRRRRPLYCVPLSSAMASRRMFRVSFQGRSFALQTFLRTGMAASPNQPISAGGDLETIFNCLLPPLRVHAMRERRRGREQTSVVYVKSVGWGEKRRRKRGKGEMAWWVVGSGIVRRSVKRPRVGQSRGPLVLAPSPVFTLFYPCNRQPFDCIFNLPCSYLYICIFACLYPDGIISSLSPPFFRCIFPFSFVLVIQLLSAHWKVSAISHAPSPRLIWSRGLSIMQPVRYWFCFMYSEKCGDRLLFAWTKGGGHE
jgi:hypothetical protein